MAGIATCESNNPMPRPFGRCAVVKDVEPVIRPIDPLNIYFRHKVILRQSAGWKYHLRGSRKWTANFECTVNVSLLDLNKSLTNFIRFLKYLSNSWEK